MDHDAKRFIREARRETKLLIEQCSYLQEEQAAPPCETFDRETEVIMRSSIGGSANLGFFLPYLWKHRH